jgi:RNA polymerase sigma-70 factor (ECF subfamily)
MNATDRQDGADADLLTDVASGEASAFERLYKRYERRVYQYVCTFVYDSTMAEEILTDTMLAVWRGAGTFGGGSRVSTWIFGIARHKALDALRRSGRHRHDVTLDSAVDLTSPQQSPAEGVLRNQVAAVTQRALAALTVEHREVLRLVFYEELPYEEIATLLGIPENTVKTRVYYAKQRLKEQLERVTHKGSIP